MSKCQLCPPYDLVSQPQGRSVLGIWGGGGGGLDLCHLQPEGGRGRTEYKPVFGYNFLSPSLQGCISHTGLHWQ